MIDVEGILFVGLIILIIWILAKTKKENGGCAVVFMILFMIALVISKLS